MRTGMGSALGFVNETSLPAPSPAGRRGDRAAHPVLGRLRAGGARCARPRCPTASIACSMPAASSSAMPLNATPRRHEVVFVDSRTPGLARSSTTCAELGRALARDRAPRRRPRRDGADQRSAGRPQRHDRRAHPLARRARRGAAGRHHARLRFPARQRDDRSSAGAMRWQSVPTC